MNASPILSINKADFGYMAGLRFVPVISNVSFEVPPGSFVVLEGPNGCGKSTILRALLKMGAVFQGDVILRVPMEKIGYIPQEPELARNAPITAGDIVRSAFPFGKIDNTSISRALARVGLENKDGVRYGSLSGGQRRRALLARALAHDARLIILDEPTANIDRETERSLEFMLFDLIANGKISILATTHAAHWAKSARRISLVRREDA